jgi:site-specific DNA-methyltransferase (adenine-specific)
VKPYYEHAGITIYHGDCREILPTLGKFDLLLTDPPYGINFAGQPTKWQRLAGAKPEAWDATAPVWFPEFVAQYQSACVWGGNYLALPPSRGWLIWLKPDAPPSMGPAELAWTSRDENVATISQSISKTNHERVGHPTQKPLRVMKWCLEFFPDAKVILDPFMGSGTTLRAVKDAGLIATGIEIEERYCEIAAKRLAQEVLFG